MVQPNINTEKIADTMAVQAQLESLPVEQKMYIAGIIMGLALENTWKQLTTQ